MPQALSFVASAGHDCLKRPGKASGNTSWQDTTIIAKPDKMLKIFI
jgi:hypothetical protein